MANPPNIRLRGNRFSMPAGYIVGRSKGGKGPPQLINLQTLASQVAIAGGGSSGGVTPGSGIELTDGTHDLTGVAKITVTGATVGGSSPNATLTALNARGAWNGSVAYAMGDVVTYNGSAYECYAAVSAPVATAAAWNPATLGAHMALSTTLTSNDTATTSAGGTGDQYVESLSDSKSTGKWYYEVGISGYFDAGTQFGVATAAEIPGLSDHLISAEFAGPAVSNFSGGGSGTVGALINGKRAAMAIDFTNSLFWFTPDVTASPIAWNNSTSNAPGGSGGIATGTVSAAVFKWFYGQGHTGQVTQLFSRAADLLIPSVPSGFSPWVQSAGSPNTSPDQDDTHWLSQGAINTVDSNFTITSGQLSLTPIASGDVLGVSGGSTAEPTAATLTAMLDRAFGSTEGQILQRGASAWQVLAPGTVNQVLESGGAAALNSWVGLSALLDTVFGSTEGNVLQRGASVWQVLAPGTAGQRLNSGGAAALNSWVTPLIISAGQASASGNVSTTSTTLVMGGSKCTYTPAQSGKIMCVASMQISNDTKNDIVQAGLYYGTGTAPNSGAAVTGTQGSATLYDIQNPNLAGVGGGFYQVDPSFFAALTVGTAYWFDFAFLIIGAGSTATITNPGFQIVEW